MLTAQDRKHLDDTTEHALNAGYDRLIVETLGDGSEATDVLVAFREGEAWSTWAFARNGDAISAWSTTSGEDAGVFRSLWEALHTVLVRNQLS